MVISVSQSDGYAEHQRRTTDATDYAVMMYERYVSAYEKMENAERELRVALVGKDVNMKEYYRRIGEKYV